LAWYADVPSALLRKLAEEKLGPVFGIGEDANLTYEIFVPTDSLVTW